MANNEGGNPYQQMLNFIVNEVNKLIVFNDVNEAAICELDLNIQKELILKEKQV